MTSFRSTKPQMDRVSFRRHDFLTINLEDGRILSVPLSRFPNIEKLSAEQRRKYHIADGIALMFPGDDEVYHIDDFMGLNDSRLKLGNSFHLAN